MQKQTFVAGEPGLDPTLPDVELVIGGKSYQLCYDHNAIVLAEKATGINLLESALRIQSAETLRGMLWASLLRSHPDLTIDEVGAWLHPRNFATVRNALLAAWFGSVPDVKDGDAGEAQGEASPNASPSPTSGPARATTSGSRKRSSGGSRRASSTRSAAGSAKSEPIAS